VTTLAVVCSLAACERAARPAEQRGVRAARAQSDIAVAAAWPWALRKEIRYGDGLDLAVDEINAQGGIGGRRLRLVRVDDKESIDGGLRAAQRIVSDPDIVAVIGHLQSFISVPAAAIYDLGGVVMIAPAATDPELTTRGYRRVFRITFTDRGIGRQLAEFAARSGYRRVGIEYIRNGYGRGLANAFEERASEVNIAVVARQSYDPTEQVSQRTFAAAVREWQNVEMDAIFLAGETPSAGLFIAEARAGGIRVPIFGGDALGTPALMGVAARSAEGTVVATVYHPDASTAEAQRFVGAFSRRYKALPDAGAALAYDAVRVLADAIRRAGTSTPDAIATALHGLRGWNGVTGPLTFDERGDVVNRPLVKMVVRNQRFVLLREPPVTSQ
jgi:branched-chain amino acid transport system substrate-binding protein